MAVNYGELYSGALFVSTGCDTYSNACETGICRNKHCDLSTGAVGPHTRAEWTFDPKNIDFYDISLMHGVNVPMSMTPTNGQRDQQNAYSCGAAGSTSAANGFPACSYAYNSVVNGVEHNTNIAFVAAPDLNNLKVCASNNDCAPGTVCGLAAGRDPTGLPTTDVLKVCGAQVGIWSMDEVCVYSAGQYSASPYTCSNGVAYGTYTNLYACSGAYVQSGYQPDSQTDKVCGCYDWEGMPETEQCLHVNPDWLAVAYPWARLLKDACPLAYSYAYDDMTSTFVCAGSGQDAALNYDIAFCPGGVELTKL